MLPFAMLFLVSCGETPATSTDTTKKDSVVVVPVKIDSTRPGTELPKAMNITHKSAYDDFYVRYDDSNYYCSYKGRFEVADTFGNRKRTLFSLDAEYIIDAIYIYRIDATRFFIAWQETDHLGVHSYFAQHTEGGKKPDWRMQVNAPSPGQPVVDSPYVFVSTLGMIGKLDMHTGKAAWRHDSLFNPYSLAFKKFDRPKVFQNSICYYDFTIKGKKNKRDTIWVDDRTGEMR